MNKVDVLISHGRVMDPHAGVDAIGPVAVKNGRTVKADAFSQAPFTLDATGCLVLPGLVDSHAHVFDKGGDLGIPADLCMLPYGVTTVGEGGSSGTANYESCISTLAAGRMHWKMLLNVCPSGLSTFQFPEPLLPNAWDCNRFQRAFDLYGEHLLGLKVRLSDDVVGGRGFEILDSTLDLAKKLGVRVSVHVTAMSLPQSELVARLRPNDIYCHVYQGTGETILDARGKVHKAFFEAQERGVLFDAASGKNNFTFAVARAAIQQGFYPDVICSDVSSMNYLGPYVGNGLPHIMSKFLALGMSLEDIIPRVTSKAAHLMGLQNKVGTLLTGACGDVAVFRLAEGTYRFLDSHNETLEGTQLFVPVATIQAGQLVFQRCHE